MNTVGTLGVSSAGYWWSRLAALLLRVIYVLRGADHPAYILLFSHDGFITAVGPAFHKTILLVVLILEIFSVPLSWKKVKGGLEVDWVGYWTKAIFGAGMVPEDRQQRSRLGKMFARILAGPVHQVRPYLGPMYAWTSWDFRADAADREPHAALVTSTSQQRCLEGLRVAAGEVFRIDAKVEGSDLIVLGGRFTGSPPDKRTAKLLSTRITREHVQVILLVPENLGKDLGAGIVEIAVARQLVK